MILKPQNTLLVLLLTALFFLSSFYFSSNNNTTFARDKKDDQPLQGVTVAVDPGHGGYDPGAVGVTGVQEKEVALKASFKLAEHLQEQGAKVVFTRDSDYNPGFYPRVNLAHRAGADVFISIHANHHPDPGISGVETYFYSWGNFALSSRKLARLVQDEMVSYSGLRDIGIQHGSFYVIRAPQMPSILVELGFLSNYHDESLLKQDSYLEGQARSISNGLVEYFAN